MQKIAFLFFLFLSGITARCQQQYFVYIQADEHQPFYAKLNNKIYSSSEKGYMIISKLEDKTHELTIGFPKSPVPEQRFTINLDNKDQGFQLKRFEDKGWGLFNLQTMAISMNAGSADQSTEEVSGVKKTDAFSELLANVVNDSAILYSAARPKPAQAVRKDTLVANQASVAKKDTVSTTPVAPGLSGPVKKAEAEPTVSQPVTAAPAKKDSVSGLAGASQAAAGNESVNKDPVKEQPANSRVRPEKPFISKIREEKTADSYTATYLEQYIYSTDTIRISIPVQSQVSATPAASEKIDESTPVKDGRAAISSTAGPDTATRKPAIVLLNSDCKKIASDHDLDKLRVKLLNDKTIDDKIVTSKKAFKSRCLTVKQVRALSELFPSDETRLRFFEAAYPFVSDTGNFVLLEDLVSNEFYKTQFKAMLHK